MTQPALVLLPGLLCDDWLRHAQVAALGDVAEISVADLTLDDSVLSMAETTRVLRE
ncbi:MAG: hypothetical protein H7Z40_14790 [Phycisphaerae bacterium]|nr:hypothetical protein [Gemmatimonadaceae bacterium]